MPCHAIPGRNGRSFFPLISLSQRRNVHCCEMGEMGIPVSFLSPGLRIIEQNRAKMVSIVSTRLNKTFSVQFAGWIALAWLALLSYK